MGYKNTGHNGVHAGVHAQGHQTGEGFPSAAQWQEFLRLKGGGDEAIDRFKSEIYRHYRQSGREFSWRSEITPYRVLVSEIMLQQTQTSRVDTKFEPFITEFPDFGELAAASFSDVLRFWKGLGYNRRAKYLHDCAQLVMSDFKGRLPEDPEILVRFPGIGKATAASICVFAFNSPHVFIETNIRTVFIHFFFSDRTRVADKEIAALVEQSLDRENPREWFYALMDYGVMLKKQVGNLSRKSKHYHKQSSFEGSDRQLRGRILQLLLDHESLQVVQLPELLGQPSERVVTLIDALCSEGLVRKRGDVLSLN